MVGLDNFCTRLRQDGYPGVAAAVWSVRYNVSGFGHVLYLERPKRNENLGKTTKNFKNIGKQIKTKEQLRKTYKKQVNPS